jgi:hypothetical protein
MRTLQQLLSELNVDSARRVTIAFTLGVTSDPAAEARASRRERPTHYAAVAGPVRLLVGAEEADLLRKHGASDHVIIPPQPARASRVFVRPPKRMLH